jgi:hypothetical protein
MSARMQYRCGYHVGNGAAINIELGFVPDRARVVNLTDGDLDTEAFLGGDRYVIPFSGGGTTEIAVGDKIWGVTSNASAFVEEVLLSSGSWSGGDAVGFFIVRDVVGTFGSENVNNVGDSSSADYATVTVNVNHCIATAAAVAAATGNAALSKYVGASGSAGKGFTIGSTVAEEAKLLFWEAWRGM